MCGDIVKGAYRDVLRQQSNRTASSVAALTKNHN